MVDVVGTPSLLVKDIWAGDNWNYERLEQLIGDEMADEVMRKICVGKPGQDVLVWKPAQDGQFSTTSTWNLIRVKGDHFTWMDWIWNKCLRRSRHVCGVLGLNVCPLMIE